ncbi:SDR family NAD(P)-dependent oxidoreductase [Pseudaestuariivita atlantica]|uniref:Short-chain dehydrogenase n=1 Tax=Pseudaestuariivita atlantica TaxID=1317121 RepID=A0A0L1JUM6_9RHOB|nr:SDR family NAD(P)-dependent oxidoreductase [Pseudaestuariivita atlantica]KNG95445.1 short-chain dehydrogenase [Pseudaestuariivita atlantica]
MRPSDLKPDHVAVISGGAQGLGLSAALRFAARGMAVVVADVNADALQVAETRLRDAGARAVLAHQTDVSDRDAVRALRDEVDATLGGADVVMANAGIQPGSDIFDAQGTWDRVLAVNLGGIVALCQSFVPGMIARGRPGMVIATGSKQGITTPPGDPAYNVAKAGVRAFAEALAHHLREVDAPVSAHLFIPGFVFTKLNRRGRTEKPEGAWTPDQTTAFLFDRIEAGDFYVLCPDNDVTREMDEKRMAWAMGDIIDNRPPLSRWHPDWAERFAAYLEGG